MSTVSTVNSTIPDAYVEEFKSSWSRVSQQEMKRLEGCYMPVTVEGQAASFPQVGPVDMVKVQNRLTPTVGQEMDTELRWIYPQWYQAVTHFDRKDRKLLGNRVLPTSETVIEHASAKARVADQVLIDALDAATSPTGETGATNTSFLAGNIVAVNHTAPGVTPANGGLTLAKLIKAKSILGKNEVIQGQKMARGELICIVKQQHLDDLLYSVDQVRSADYNAVRALVDGEVDYFMNFRFIRSELLPWEDEANDISRALVYHKRAVFFSENNEEVDIDVRKDLNYAIQLMSGGWYGATRNDEAAVVRLLCDESP